MVLNGDIDICCYWVTTVSEVAEVGLSTPPPPNPNCLFLLNIIDSPLSKAPA